MKGEMNYNQLVSWLDEIGWEKGYSILKENHKTLEKQHAFLSGGDYNEQRKATKLMHTLVKQDECLVRLMIIANERGIRIDCSH
jgi:hypothetical protein